MKGTWIEVKIKEGIGWKAACNEEKGVYGAEVVFQGSWDLYEITAEAYDRLTANTGSREAEQLICAGRRLYSHVNDRCGPPYTIVLDDDYREYCPWMGEAPKEETWSTEMTDAAVELFESEKQNRAQRREKRKKRMQNGK